MDIKWSLQSVCTEAVHDINKSLYRIGRHRDHDIVCGSVVISREHANIIVDCNKLYLQDLGSSNGTYIDGRRIKEQELECLQDSNIISFGLPTHVSPCSPYGCFFYKVNKKCPLNSTVDIVSILEDSQDKLDVPNTEIDKIDKNICEIVTENKNNGDLKLDNICIKEEIIEQTESNKRECGYSVKDNVIIINDDVDDVNELSASQLFSINDPYCKIKEELSEYDRVDVRPPVIVDSDDGCDFDIFEILNGASIDSGAKGLDLNGLDKEIYKSVDNGNCVRDEMLSDAVNSSDTEECDINTSSDNLQIVTSKCKEVNKTSAADSSKSKYIKPPIIEAPVLRKPLQNLRSKSKENNKPLLKRSSTSPGKNNRTKKRKTGSNIYEAQPSTSYTSVTTNATKLSKEDTLRIKEKRKLKLKEISKQTSGDIGQFKKPQNCGSKPRIKESKNRGEFMLNEAPPAVNPRRKTLSTVTCSSKPTDKLSSSTKRSTSLSKNGLTDPRFKNTVNGSNCPPSALKSSLPDARIENKSVPNTEYISYHNKSKFSNKPNGINASSFDNIMSILNWRTQWLEEQKKCSTYPPVNKRPAIKMCNKFADHRDYVNVVTALLMIELWNEMFEDWISIDTPEKQNKRKFSAVIGEVEVKPSHFVLKCTAYITRQQNYSKQHVKENNIVLLHVPTEKDGQFMYQSLFGFVMNCEKRLIKGNDFVDEYLSRQLQPQVPESMLHLDIAIKAQSNRICLNKCMEGAILLPLVTILREFDAVCNLKYSALCNFILDPKVEDYILPNNFRPTENTMADLNGMQARVVWEATQLCLGNSAGIMLVQGPPGTGKTTVIKNIVKNVILNSDGKKHKLLLTAPSNSAIDSLALKIVKELKSCLPDEDKKKIKLVRLGPWNAVNEEVRPYLLDQLAKIEVKRIFVNDHPEAKKDLEAVCNKRNALKNKLKSSKETNENNIKALKQELLAMDFKYESFARDYLKHEYQKTFEIARERVYNGSNIVCTTLSSCARLKELNNIPIDCCIVDEATQSKEPETLIPLLLGVTKFILVGDPQQLPAVTTSMHAKSLDYGQSLFQRIKKNFADSPTNPIRMLNLQHRMHPEISLFPNNAFYAGELHNSDTCSQRSKFKLLPYHVFNLNLKHNQENVQNMNTEEIEFTFKLIEAINSIALGKKPVGKINIGIITPYNNQREAFLKTIERNSYPATLSITVNTVDSFQGLEKDIIILSCVRYRPNIFLSDEQRLNVALTRAKHALYIVGTYSLFKNCSLLNRVRMDAERRKLYVNIGSTSVVQLKKIIKCA